MILPGTVVSSSQGPLSTLFKKGYDISFLPVTGDFDSCEVGMSEKVPFMGRTKHCCFSIKEF